MRAWRVASTRICRSDHFLSFLPITNLLHSDSVSSSPLPLVITKSMADCPQPYHRNHASDERAVLATELLSILAGTTATHRSWRFARMASTPS